jgi:hypothetical protein
LKRPVTLLGPEEHVAVAGFGEKEPEARSGGAVSLTAWSDVDEVSSGK